MQAPAEQMPQTPQHWRAGEPKEVAPAYVLLASDRAGFISGAVVSGSGGKPIR